MCQYTSSGNSKTSSITIGDGGILTHNENSYHPANGACWYVESKENNGTIIYLRGAPATTEYPLWVGGTQVTSVASSGTGWSYAADTHTLTLNNLTSLSGAHENAAIYYFGEDNLNIVLQGSSSFSTSEKYGIYSEKGIAISGDGSLSIKVTDNEGYGLFAKSGDVVISGGTINAEASGMGGKGIYASKDVTISGGTVTGTGKYGIDGEVNITINGDNRIIGLSQMAIEKREAA